MEILDLSTSYSKTGDVLLTVTIPKHQNEAVESLLGDIGDKYDKYEMLLKAKGRSLDANAYMWVICDKIAKKIGHTTKVDVYQKAIRDVGLFEDVPIKNEEVESKIALWNSIGDGWLAESQRDSKLNGYTVVRRYFGSSIYDNFNMRHLIDYIVDEAIELKIEVKTPNELERLKALWKGRE